METILIIFVAYFALLGALLVWARPYQKRVQALGAEILQSEMSPIERRFIEGLVASSHSYRAAIVMLLAFLIGIFQTGETLDRECAGFDRQHPVLANDTRVHALMEAHFASAIAVNPFVGVLAIFARYAFELKALLHHDSKHVRKIADFVGLGARV